MITTNRDQSTKGSKPNREHLVIVGATGMVGGYALHYALENSPVKSVTSIGRKKLGISHPKLQEAVHAVGKVLVYAPRQKIAAS